VKERSQFTRRRIDACEVRALAQVAAMTRKRQVVNRVAAAMLPGRNVFDMVLGIAVLLPQ